MKGLIAAGILCALLAVVSAQETAKAQWHVRAPERGCVEVSHTVGGSTFRSYACDGLNDACLFAPHVNTCPTSALFHKPSLERVANIRSRDHLVRYYNQIGGACVLSLLSDCCPGSEEIVEVEDDKCKTMTLPNGEVLSDPVGCDKFVEVEDNECKTVTLPTGEVISDPVGCEKGGEAQQEVEEQKALAKLLKMLLNN